MEREPASCWLRAGIVLTLLALVLAGMVLWPHSLAVQIINGAPLGFAFMQIGFLMDDLLYDELNCQIEHHLFPSLRQDQLGAARAIVRPFCLERGMRYHETGIFQSLKESFRHLQEVGASVRVDDPVKILNP